MSLTVKEAQQKAARWNAYSYRNITLHCPVEDRTWEGTGTRCPYCHSQIDRTHWKWYSPDEPRPDV